MTRICFWNLRHLSEGSDQDRRSAIKDTVAGLKSDYTLFCELTTQSQYPQAVNLTYRKQSPAQLCYGCLDNVGDDITINKYTPTSTPQYAQANFKGGTDFTHLADRAVGYIGVVNTVPIYVIHAPSGKNGRAGQKAMSFIACHFNSIYVHNPWLIIGDFNVEPDMLAQVDGRVGIQVSSLIRSPGEITYIGPFGSQGKILDYVLCNFQQARVSRIKTSPRHHNSDHYPIIVEW